VGSLSLHYIYEFRELLKTCVIILDLKADSLVKLSSISLRLTFLRYKQIGKVQ
jgi:hypothetical protein